MLDVRKITGGHFSVGKLFDGNKEFSEIGAAGIWNHEGKYHLTVSSEAAITERNLLLGKSFIDFLNSSIGSFDVGISPDEYNFYDELPRNKAKNGIIQNVIMVSFKSFGGKYRYSPPNAKEVFIGLIAKASNYNWGNPFTYSDYTNILKQEVLKLNNPQITFKKDFYGQVWFIVNDLTKTLKEEIENCKLIVQKLHKNVILELEKQSEQTSIKQFNFPPEVRISCEQYLQYFVEFLRDVGVKATANIQHDNLGRTLFNVKPDNPKIALDAIREALEIYLELPMSPLVNDEYVSDSKMLSLRAEINTLKTRLDLAQIKQIEQEKRTDLQRELIDTQKEILREKDNRIQTLQKFEPRNFEPSVVYESAIESNYVDAEIVEEKSIEKITETSNKEIDLGLVTVKPAKIVLGVEANTPRLTRLGIKKGKELFDYLHEKFNSEEEK